MGAGSRYVLRKLKSSLAGRLPPYCRIPTEFTLSPARGVACQTLPMDTEENIRALSRRVTDAPEDSKEFLDVMDKLRATVKARAARGREQLAVFQRAFQGSGHMHPSR